MIIMDDFYSLEKEIKRLMMEQERNKGAIRQIKLALKDAFGKKVSIKTAKRLFKQLRKQEHDYFTEYRKRKERFLRRWGDKLNLGKAAKIQKKSRDGKK